MGHFHISSPLLVWIPALTKATPPGLLSMALFSLCPVVVAKSCLTLCEPMNCSTSGFPVLHHLPEFAQTLSIESMMPSNHLILFRPLLLLPSIFPSMRVFSNELALCIRWPKYYRSFSIRPSKEYSGLISLGLTGLISLLSKELSRVFFSITVLKHQFFSAQPSLWSNSHIYT